jgi:membrane fusion protein (multidrug efflux system)
MTLLVGKSEMRLAKKTALLAAAILVVATVGLGACKNVEGGEKKGEEEPVTPVAVEQAQARSVAIEVFLAGDVRADVNVRVVSLVPERILKLEFEEGDEVKKGDVLAVVKAGSLYDAVRAAKAGLKAAKTQKELAEIELERTKKLYKTGTVPIAQLQRAQAQFDSAKAQLSQAKAQLSSSYSNISNVTIRAPISGVIGQRFLNEGDTASPQTPICTIVKLDEVRVKAMATEFDLVKLEKNQPARVTVPAFEERVWKGKVDYLSPVLDRSTRSAWVTVLVENEDMKLRPGMFADVVVEVGRREDVVMVPARSVKRRVMPDGNVLHRVFVVKGDRVEAREVDTGVRKDGNIEIKKGIKRGEAVVTLGSHLVKDGTKVKITKNPLKR